MNAITPNGVHAVNTNRWRPSDLLACVDLRDIRRARLEKFAKSRGVNDNPGGLGELIGKKGNQVYNLLHGDASFGEKVARSIETSAGLPAGWLDVEDGEQPQLWPFRTIDLERVLRLSREDFIRVEAKLDAAIEHCEDSAIRKSAIQQPEETPPQVTDKLPIEAYAGLSKDELLRELKRLTGDEGVAHAEGSKSRRASRPGSRKRA